MCPDIWPEEIFKKTKGNFYKKILNLVVESCLPQTRDSQHFNLPASLQLKVEKVIEEKNVENQVAQIEIFIKLNIIKEKSIKENLKFSFRLRNYLDTLNELKIKYKKQINDKRAL